MQYVAKKLYNLIKILRILWWVVWFGDEAAFLKGTTI